MNYYNPYFYGLSPSTLGSATSLGSKITFSSILNNAQKVVGILNQTIPMVKQVTPIVKNAKTMFKVMNEFKKVDTPVNNVINEASKIDEVTEEKPIVTNSNGPTFFL